MLTRLFLLPFILSITSLSFAQKGDFELASDHLSVGNFEAALDEFLLLLENNPGDPKISYRVAVCYLNINADEIKAIPYLDTVLAKGKHDNNAFYLMGIAYHYARRFDDAIKMFEKFNKAGGGTAASTAEANKRIEYAQNAKELMKFPMDVKFENLGPNINSIYSDYYPFVPIDESFIVFNSRRNDGSKRFDNGSFASNVYSSKVEKGEFQKVSPLPKNINTSDGNEEVVGLSALGDIMLLFMENKNTTGELFITTENEDHTFGKPVLLEETINSKDLEIAATISKDGTILYFASDRKGGYGGTDIYMSKKLPIGGWGPAQNLGPEINSPFDEDFPNISPDGKTLLFSSKGHTSMGGYDIFASTWNPSTKKFENVRNFGQPINTVHDDTNLRLSESGRHGYIAAIRPEGLGDYDIYRVTFNDMDPKFTVMKGMVRSTDPSKKMDDLFISVTEKKSGDVFGDYLPNFNTMRYIIILPPGEYQLTAEAGGFKTLSENIKILDKSSFQAEIDRDIVLSPK